MGRGRLMADVPSIVTDRIQDRSFIRSCLDFIVVLASR
jgi:hypothetical protein